MHGSTIPDTLSPIVRHHGPQVLVGFLQEEVPQALYVIVFLILIYFL